jgi:hypothetical protein
MTPSHSIRPTRFARMRKGLNVKPIYSVVLLAAWFAPALEATPAQDPPPPQQVGAATARTPEKVAEMLGAKLNPSDDAGGAGDARSNPRADAKPRGELAGFEVSSRRQSKRYWTVTDVDPEELE